MRITNHANLPRDQIARIEVALAEPQNLNDVMRWALAHPPSTFIPAVVAEVVVQDEFTHDVVVPYGDGLVLVYDTTLLGAVTAVAVWDHVPSADEILEKRLADSWEPRPSMLRGGDKVVGHAACVVTNI